VRNCQVGDAGFCRESGACSDSSYRASITYHIGARLANAETLGGRLSRRLPVQENTRAGSASRCRQHAAKKRQFGSGAGVDIGPLMGGRVNG
jgi:hypothetical protein